MLYLTNVMIISIILLREVACTYNVGVRFMTFVPTLVTGQIVEERVGGVLQNEEVMNG